MSRVKCTLDNGIMYLEFEGHKLPVHKYDRNNRSFIYAEHEIAKIVKYDGIDIMLFTSLENDNVFYTFHDEQLIAEIEDYGKKWSGMRR